jgi:uncharacterized membrane protein
MSETVAAPPVTSRMPRWLWTLLIVSLALNLLLIGLIVGASVLRHRWSGPVAMGAAPLGYLRTLPKERRNELWEAGRPRLATMRPLWQQAREARREADRLFTAETFDAQRFIAAQQRVLEIELDARKAATQLMAEAGSRLSVAERQEMIRWRDRHGRRGRDRGPREDRPDEPGGPPERRP